MTSGIEHKNSAAIRGTLMMTGRAALAALAGGLVLASCSSTEVENVPMPSGGARVVRITGSKPAETPPDPRTANPTQGELASSLRRITVRYYGVTLWNRSDPRPLLSERQVDDFAVVLAAELPRLQENQHLNFQFDDRKMGKGYLVSMDVYREGIFITYRFDALAANPPLGGLPGDYPRFGGDLEAKPGQEVFNGHSLAFVKDPLLESVRTAAADLQAKRALLDAAFATDLADPSDRARLEPLVLRSTPSLDSWKNYWEKRRTLKKAFEQNLMDRAAFQAQVERLTAELER